VERKRLFVAIELPQEVKEELAIICQYFAKRELFVGRCTRSENLPQKGQFILS